MKTSVLTLFFAVFVFVPEHLVDAGVPPSADPAVALLSKVIQTVSRKQEGKDWLKAERGETLESGDKIRTGERSLALIKFKDNSLVRVREQSELTITGTLSGTAFSKSVTIDAGSLGFHIQKQQTDEEFRFTSPTSVASIRGTAGLFAAGQKEDTLVVIDGQVNLTNKASSQSVNVPSGFTGLAGSDGSLQTRVSTPDERAAAEDAAKLGDVIRKLELELRDGQGRLKDLRIDFSE